MPYEKDRDHSTFCWIADASIRGSCSQRYWTVIVQYGIILGRS